MDLGGGLSGLSSGSPERYVTDCTATTPEWCVLLSEHNTERNTHSYLPESGAAGLAGTPAKRRPSPRARLQTPLTVTGPQADKAAL